MLKILIVDDEIILRKGLSKSISKVKDFVVAGEAGDGLQALKLIEEVEPDVVITDIRMPNMDGKELVQVLSEKYPELKKVVISGFEDFTYVRHTMKNGAVDYLLKPVEDDKLYALLKEIQESIRMDKKKKDEFIDHNIKLNESFPILKDRFLHGVLTAGQPYESSEDIARKLNYYGINFTPEDRFTLLFISIDNYKLFSSKYGEEEGKIKYYIIRNISEEIVEAKAGFFSCQLEFGLAVFINTCDRQLINEITGSIRFNLDRHAQISFTIAVSSVPGGIFDLNSLYCSVCKAMEHRYYYNININTVIEQNSVRPFQNWDAEGEAVKIELENSIERVIEQPDATGIRKVFSDAFHKIRQKNFVPQDVNQMFKDIFLKMKFKFDDFKRAVELLDTSGYSYVQQLEMLDTADEIEKLSVNVYTELTKQILYLRSRKDKKIVEVVKDYVAKHYSEDITLAKITGLVYVNGNYFSEMFKTCTGENFIDYLTRVRIDRAKTLLKDVAVKTYEVGMLVGYADPNYFSKVFKKVVGITPSQYRNIVL